MRLIVIRFAVTLPANTERHRFGEELDHHIPSTHGNDVLLREKLRQFTYVLKDRTLNAVRISSSNGIAGPEIVKLENYTNC